MKFRRGRISENSLKSLGHVSFARAELRSLERKKERKKKKEKKRKKENSRPVEKIRKKQDKFPNVTMCGRSGNFVGVREGFRVVSRPVLHM